MDDSEELRLVIKALCDGLGNGVYWSERSAYNVRNNRDMRGIPPERIRSELLRLVRVGGVSVQQKRETRDEYKQKYKFYYMSILSIEPFQHGLFVEYRLVDWDDPEFPVVLLVNAHPESKL